MKGLINNEQEKMKVLMNFKGQTYKGIIAPALWISLFGLLGCHAKYNPPAKSGYKVGHQVTYLGASFSFTSNSQHHKYVEVCKPIERVLPLLNLRLVSWMVAQMPSVQHLLP